MLFTQENPFQLLAVSQKKKSVKKSTIYIDSTFFCYATG